MTANTVGHVRSRPHGGRVSGGPCLRCAVAFGKRRDWL